MFFPFIRFDFSTICALLQIKIFSNESNIKSYLEETIKSRLLTDISDTFHLNSFTFNDKDDSQLNIMVENFLNFVRKLAESMSTISDYNRLFALFGISYVKICFFETNSAGDRVKTTRK